MRIRGADVELWLEPGARRSDEEIEEIALVDLACALFLAARAYHTWHIHAACVVDPVLGPLLIAGQSGSGKSTTTIALIARGARWLADDTVLARREGDNIRVFGVPRLFHVTPRTLELFPALADACVPGRRSLAGKSCLDPEQAFPGAQEQRGVVPKLVVLPEVRGERTAGRPAQAADALGALIESSTWVTIDDLPGNDEHLAALAQLAGNVRAVQLALAPDAMAPGDPIRAAIAQAVSSAG